MTTPARILAALGLVLVLSSPAAAQTAPIPVKGTVHGIWSMDAMLLQDPLTCTSYQEFSASSCAMAWKEAPPMDSLPPAWSAFFNASVVPATPIALSYEFRLVSLNFSSVDEINGTWMVFRNRMLVSRTCRGSAYGLNQGPGRNYFKLVCTDPSAPSVCAAIPQWLFIGYITERYDY